MEFLSFLLIETDIKIRPFVFIMANYFYKTHDRRYPPAEIAVAKFNFENAILKSYHTFVNPGKPFVAFIGTIQKEMSQNVEDF